MPQSRIPLHIISGLCAFCTSLSLTFAADQLAFPGAEGFGAHAKGGRGGRVIEVTNLNDAGPGSLRAACEAKGPRLVVFRVAGIIHLEKTLTITNPFLTIAGQTAPGDGICIRHHPVLVDRAHDVILRHLRIRMGDLTKGKEVSEHAPGEIMTPLNVQDSQNVVVDHCSLSWSVDEVFDVWSTLQGRKEQIDTKNITVQWTIISEGLHDSYHHKGPHGYGGILAGNGGGVTMHHCLFAHHADRSPNAHGYPDSEGSILDFRNNVIYNWGNFAGITSWDGTSRSKVVLGNRLRTNYVGNYHKPGPSTLRPKRSPYYLSGVLHTFYTADNVLVGDRERTADNWKLFYMLGGATGHEVQTSRPFDAPDVKTESAEAAYRSVLKQCGATWPVRDAVDIRVLKELKDGTGRIIDSQADVGGWPQYRSPPPPADTDHDAMPDGWERQHGFDPKNPADGKQDRDQDGYTNVEEFLNKTEP